MVGGDYHGFLISVRRGDSLGFLDLHVLAAAGQFTFTGLGAERLGAAFRAAISFT
jgi:hypothetical protein